MSGNILFLGNKIFEIPLFFQTRPGDLGENVRACSLRFSALNHYGRSISFPGFSPTGRGRVGENPRNQVELCTAKYCLLLKAFEKKKIVFN